MPGSNLSILIPGRCLAALTLCGCLAACSRQESAAGSEGIRFVDVAIGRGLNRILVSGGSEKMVIVENIGTGVGVLDADGDGRLDLFFSNAGTLADGRIVQGPGVALFRQDSVGNFQELTSQLGLEFNGWGTGVAVGDYDNDGDPDLFLSCWGPDRLWENRQGKFFDVSSRAGVDHPGLSTSAVFLDYDLDGRLDLYVACYVELDLADLPNSGEPCIEGSARVACGPDFYEPASDRLYHNEGDGHFRLVSDEAGLDVVSGGYGLGVAVDDFNRDGRPDIYVANDTTENFLWMNVAGKGFVDEALSAGASLGAEGQGQAGMGVAIGDVDGDCRADIFVTNYSQEQNALYRCVGDAEFRDASSGSGFGRESFISLGWSTFFADIDNDSDDDLFIANGHVHPDAADLNSALSYLQPCLFYLNDGRGDFRLAPSSVGPGAVEARAHRGAAQGDIDGDGDIDIVVTVQDGRPVFLENQSRGEARSLLVELAGTQSNREGIGAMLVGMVGERKILRRVGRGGGYLSARDARAHFGLGKSTRLDSLEISWPSGKRSILKDLAAGMIYRIRESDGAVETATRLTGRD